MDLDHHSIEVDPVTFQMVNGHTVKIEAGRFWEKLSEEDRREGKKARLYYAIRVYCSEDTLPRRIVQQHEFRSGKDYAPATLKILWRWLTGHASGRACREHDHLDDFLEVFSARMAHLSSVDDDVSLHYDLHQLEAHERMDDPTRPNLNPPFRRL